MIYPQLQWNCHTTAARKKGTDSRTARQLQSVNLLVGDISTCFVNLSVLSIVQRFSRDLECFYQYTTIGRFKRARTRGTEEAMMGVSDEGRSMRSKAEATSGDWGVRQLYDVLAIANILSQIAMWSRRFVSARGMPVDSI